MNDGKALLAELGDRVRSGRREHGWSRKDLAQQTGLSERFLAQVESGEGNPSILSLDQIASAFGTTAASLLTAAPARRGAVIALLGLRGAGKSTVGRALAARLGAEFVELDARVEEAAGLTLREIFELHGEDHYRRVEREALAALLGYEGDDSLRRARDADSAGALTPQRNGEAGTVSSSGVEKGAPRSRFRSKVVTSEPRYGVVLATGGGIVTHAESFELLRRGATTIWLKATPEEHWERVVAQGDHRPMANDPLAMAHLKELLAKRHGLYREAAHIVETSGHSVGEIVQLILQTLAPTRTRRVPRPTRT